MTRLTDAQQYALRERKYQFPAPAGRLIECARAFSRNWRKGILITAPYTLRIR